MNTHNVSWGIALVASSIFGIIATSCVEIPEIDGRPDILPVVEDADNDGFFSSELLPARDCNDADDAVYPGAEELCDGKDNNCDGVADEEVRRVFCRDSDRDGQGDPGSTEEGCAPTEGFVESGSDCDDDDPATYRGASELCDGRDNNCDGLIDEGVTKQTWYFDEDEDGFGDNALITLDCLQPIGFVERWGDCDDSNAEINPNAIEKCNDIDDDCDEAIDDGLTMAYYVDGDLDGFGTGVKDYILSCDPIPGRAANNWDCNDANNAIFPGNPERCNGIDDNCNRAVDEPYWNYTDTPPAYVDADGDGFGDPSTAFYGCLAAQHTLTAGDCNDASANVNPDALEACNGLDDDCNGQVDEVSSLTGEECPN